MKQEDATMLAIEIAKQDRLQHGRDVLKGFFWVAVICVVGAWLL